MQEYLHAFSEHLIDWFHITMRLTVLQQQTKALQKERPETGADVSKQLESAKKSGVGVSRAEVNLRPTRVGRVEQLAGSNSAKRSSTASMTSEHTSGITASSSRTSASVDGKEKRLARHSWSRRSINWSADDSSKNSRCNGR